MYNKETIFNNNKFQHLIMRTTSKKVHKDIYLIVSVIVICMKIVLYFQNLENEKEICMFQDSVIIIIHY